MSARQVVPYSTIWGPVQIYYEAEGGNVLSAKNLARIAKLERQLLDDTPGYNSHCLHGPGSRCAPTSTILNFVTDGPYPDSCTCSDEWAQVRCLEFDQGPGRGSGQALAFAIMPFLPSWELNFIAFLFPAQVRCQVVNSSYHWQDHSVLDGSESGPILDELCQSTEELGRSKCYKWLFNWACPNARLHHRSLPP